MKKFLNVMVVLLSVLILASCGFSKNSASSSSTSSNINIESKIETRSLIDDEFLSDLTSEVNQYWFMNATFRGKGINSLNNIIWKDAEITQCFTMLDKDEALFGTLENGNIVYGRIYEIGSIDNNGFYSLKQKESIVSESYFNTKVKDKASFNEISRVKFSHVVPNEKYFSSTSDVNKKTLYLKFYSKDGVLYREDFGGKDNEILYRYSK